ncbi:hypothetical protein [Methylibium sp.]|uniref:hypothetical protein n=1 Tax=Methylibium sp. TaxID=2067992 RepID=UPI003D102DC9
MNHPPLSRVTRSIRALCSAAFGALLAATAPSASAHDYPTADRVIYVQDCMKQHPGHHYEMLNKCSCVLDKLASEVSFDDFTTMSTATNANSMGGERGNSIRDSEAMQAEIKRFRSLQTAAKKSCFIDVDAK